MADKRISQLVERVNIANNDVLPIVASGATTTNKVTVSTLQDWMQSNLDVGVTSVGLSMPSAFVVSNSPVTASGNISVTGAGTAAQYVRGDGSLADFPSGGGGGSSVSYYLNGSVSQGTIGGIAYREMNKTPILGAGTDFVAIADGYLASFITDAGDPALLEIPGGNWNFETYFSASSGGGTPSFYVELYKVNSGGTATLIASNSATPELIAFGTTITPYFSTLAVPTTSLALTDRLALRYYVARSGRTITLHTENSHLCQIITTFTTGLTALNGLTAQVQNFATGTSGTDFNISSSVSTHTFNLPDASASARGVVTTGTQTFAGYKIFNGTIGVNNDLQLVTVGTALNTFIKNINATGLTSIGSNGFGFNNANNIYFSGSSKGGGVFAFSNTGTQTYTLQDASGTLAFTSQIPTNPVGGTGAQGRVAYWNGAGTITSDSLFQWNDTFKRLGIGRTPTVSLDVEGAGYFSGALGVGGALNGTSASFTSTTEASNASTASVVLAGGLGVAKNIRTAQNIIAEGANGTIAVLNGGDFQVYTSGNANYSSISSPSSGNMVLRVNIGATPINALTLASTGAATFSSSVSAGGLLASNDRLYMPGNQPISNWFSSSLSAGYSSSNGYGWVNGAGNLVLGTNGVGRIFMTSSGAVGIGTDNPSDILTVAGNINLPNGVNRQITIGSQTNYNYRLGTDGDDFRILEASTTERLRYSYLNTRWTMTSGLTVTGSLSKGSGSFKIDHPLPEKKDTHHLVHSFVEAPQADNIYRGKIELVDGYAEVNIDEASGMSEGTFVLLNGNIQCFTSNESGWTPVKGKVDGNILKIQAQDSKCKDIISWLVIGERIDQHMIDTDWTDQNGKVIVEPLKEQEKPSDILNKDLQNQNQTQDESNA